jgi:hypothetical protein
MRINDLDSLTAENSGWRGMLMPWGPDDAGEGGLHVLSGEVGAVMELDSWRRWKV